MTKVILASENLYVILPLMMTLSIELLKGRTLRMSSPETFIFIESKSNYGLKFVYNSNGKGRSFEIQDVVIRNSSIIKIQK